METTKEPNAGPDGVPIYDEIKGEKMSSQMDQLCSQVK